MTCFVFRLIAPIVSQSVKEVLQSLVDDGMVQADKIGSSNCKITLALRTLFHDRIYALILIRSSLLELSFSAGRNGQHDDEIRGILTD